MSIVDILQLLFLTSKVSYIFNNPKKKYKQKIEQVIARFK